MKIYLDCADLNTIREFKGRVDGFTTNPTLMFKAGVTDYASFAKAAIKEAGDKPISLEVFADDFKEMERQARLIASWGNNVYVKIPITNTKGDSSEVLIEKLSNSDVKVNVTAITTADQCVYIRNKAPMIFSVFAGRIADTGHDPIKTMEEIIGRYAPNNEFMDILWASPREVLNIYQARSISADIITCTPDLLKKYWQLRGKSLDEFSLETVQMFYDDGQRAGYKL